MTQQTTVERIQERVDINKRAAEVDYASIRSDRDLTKEAQLRQLRGAYDKAVETHERLVEEFQENEHQRREQLRQDLFTPPEPRRAASEADRWLITCL